MGPERSQPEPEPSVGTLVTRGCLIIVGAFIMANVILIAHMPVGH
jgi:hypothetical protein